MAYKHNSEFHLKSAAQQNMWKKKIPAKSFIQYYKAKRAIMCLQSTKCQAR